jgi:hypothetical protein
VCVCVCSMCAAISPLVCVRATVVAGGLCVRAVVAGLGASGERRALAWDTHGEPLKRLAATGEWVPYEFF